MSYTLRRLDPIDGETILPLDDAKAHLRFLHADENEDIAQKRNEAIAYVERACGIPFITTRYRWSMRDFTARVELPMRPVTTIDRVAYFDNLGVEQDYADHRLIEDTAYPAAGGYWPSAYDYAAIEFTAGPAADDEKANMLAAVKLMLGHLVNNREAVAGVPMQEVPLAVRSLTDQVRRITV